MSYSEKNLSKIKPKYAFLIAFGLIVFIYASYTVLFNVLKLTSYRSVFQFLILAVAGGIVFYLYRYSIVSHEYKIEGDSFFIIRSDGSRTNTIAAAKDENIALFCPVSYAGGIPDGAFTAVNACSARSGERHGWLLYCTVGDGKRVKLVFDPSEELVTLLSSLFPGKLSR